MDFPGKQMDHMLVETLRQVYEWMEDDESKYIYLNRLSFVISRDYKYMRNIISKYVPDMAALNDVEIPGLLKRLPEDKDMYLYGAGEDARANLHYFVADSRFRGFCDGNKEKQASGVDGCEVISPEKLLENDSCSIVISTHRGLQQIKEFLLAKGVEENRIYSMSPYMFATQSEQYFNPDFMKFDDEEVFVDAGSCDMSTSLKLKGHCNNLKRVYAFEPDPSNYKVCMRIAAEKIGIDVAKIYCKGTWSENTTLYFDSSCDGASHISERGACSIEVTAIDDVIDPKDKVSFIKMDVEGAELESLRGAKETILKDKPKLAVCIYHKPEDMYEIPYYIKKLVPQYKLYLRHHSNGDGETVLYAMP